MQPVNRHAEDEHVHGGLADECSQHGFEEDSEGDHVVLESLFGQTHLTRAADRDVGPLHDHNHSEDRGLCLVVRIRVPAVGVLYLRRLGA